MTFVVGFSVRKELKYGIYSERCCPAFKGVLMAVKMVTTVQSSNRGHVCVENSRTLNRIFNGLL